MLAVLTLGLSVVGCSAERIVGGHGRHRGGKYDVAVATFSKDNSGVEGTITVYDGQVTVDLDFSNVDTSLISGEDACFTDGLKYHIHEMWDYSDETDRVGSAVCGSGYTGGHWDPWFACGSATGSDDCDCMDTTYDCDTDSFEESPYACEVGDWSGKYGLLVLDDSLAVSRSDCSRWETNAEDLAEKCVDIFSSVVIHCNDGTRAFCAPFVADTSTKKKSLCDDDDKEELLVEFSVDEDDTTIEVLIRDNGLFQFTVPSAAANVCNEYYLELYEMWDSSDSSAMGDDCSAAVLGSLYDPNHACHPDSSSEYCDADERCPDAETPTAVTYDCDGYDCAVGDISGRAGSAMVPRHGHGNRHDLTMVFMDDLPPSMDSYSGRGLLLTCLDTDATVSKFCATAPFATEA